MISSVHSEWFVTKFYDRSGGDEKAIDLCSAHLKWKKTWHSEDKKVYEWTQPLINFESF